MILGVLKKQQPQMKKLLFVVFIFISIVSQGQELLLDNEVFGRITTTQYREAKLFKSISPDQFHRLCENYPDYKFYFKEQEDFLDCFGAYPRVVRWELAEEELRNLRNFTRRHGGSIPTSKPRIVPEPVQEMAIQQEEPSPRMATRVDSASNEEQVYNAPVDSSQAIAAELAPHSKVTVQEIVPMNSITPSNGQEPSTMPQGPMEFKNRTLFLDGKKISLSDAMSASRNVDYMAFSRFKKAGTIRGWNYVHGGYSTLWIMTIGPRIMKGWVNPANAVVPASVGGIVAYRENMRDQYIMDGVVVYNLAISSQTK